MGEEHRTYDAKYRILKVVKGKEKWVPDRRPYFRSRYDLVREKKAAAKAIWWKKVKSDPDEHARIKEQKNTYYARLLEETGYTLTKFRGLRQKVRKKLGPGVDRDVLLQKYAESGLLTPREREYVTNRKPLRNLRQMNKEIDDVRAATRAVEGAAVDVVL